MCRIWFLAKRPKSRYLAKDVNFFKEFAVVNFNEPWMIGLEGQICNAN
jgi:hypothetical protein